MSSLLPSSDRLRPSLRSVMREHRPVLAPGCYDALSARLVEQAGFLAAYMTGFGSSAALLARPDVGLLTMSEMAENARRIVNAIDIPVIADADTGYGNAINVIRTVREYESAGVAAIQLEDQIAPKKCGHMAGKHVVPKDEMVAKIHAAVDARTNEMLVIARTDARAVEGFTAALDRAHAYREAGADVIFVEAPESEDEIRAVTASFTDTPLLFNYAEGGKTPAVTFDLLAGLGFAIVIFPISTLLAATGAMRSALARIRQDGSPINLLSDLPTFDEFTDLIGLPEVRTLEQNYRTS